MTTAGPADECQECSHCVHVLSASHLDSPPQPYTPYSDLILVPMAFPTAVQKLNWLWFTFTLFCWWGAVTSLLLFTSGLLLLSLDIGCWVLVILVPLPSYPWFDTNQQITFWWMLRLGKTLFQSAANSSGSIMKSITFFICESLLLGRGHLFIGKRKLASNQSMKELISYVLNKNEVWPVVVDRNVDHLWRKVRREW